MLHQHTHRFSDEPPPGCSGKNLPRALLVVVLFNTLIALLLTAIGFGQSFPANLLFSQCIGLSIFALQIPIDFTRAGIRPFLLYLAAIVAGALLGYTVALTLLGQPIIEALASQLRLFSVILLVSLAASAVIFYFFWMREKLVRFESEMQREKIQRLHGEKQLIDARLKMLQAQVEPHFLFNTLANVVSLIDSDATRAKRMLESFICYLRSSLAITREARTTLQSEIVIVRAYSDILRIRLGARLGFDLEIPAELLTASFPPMMLQPLVENAVKHGVEPKLDGGNVRVTAAKSEGRLKVIVEDTGIGFQGANSCGLGLANLRQRLDLLYGADARLLIEENLPCGTCVIIEIPYADSPDS